MTREEFFRKKYEIKKQDDEYDEQIIEIVSKIEYARKKAGLTQHELAEMIGVSNNTISRIETLESVPTLKVLLKICKALNLRVEIVA